MPTIRALRRLFLAQAGISTMVIGGLTATHFYLNATQPKAANVIFVIGLAIGLAVLVVAGSIVTIAMTRTLRALQAGHRATVAALLAAIDAKDQYTAEHGNAVLEHAVAIARRLGVRDDELRLVEQAALFHDVGKIGVPDAILSKTGPLSDEERRIMQRHPEIGERILRSISGYERLATIVRHEHERYDGHGYPDGLAGEEIPLVSRIILVADAYHAMTSDRPYRAALDARVAAARLLGNAGSQFDADVVHALLAELRIQPDTCIGEDAVLTGLRAA